MTVGDEEAEEALRRCLAMGADRAVRIWVDALEAADPIVVGARARRRGRARVAGPRALRRAVGGRRPGRDRESRSPSCSACRASPSSSRSSCDAAAARRRSTASSRAGSIEVVAVDTPALLTIQTGINEPRYAKLRAIKQAREKPIAVEARGRSASSRRRSRRRRVAPRMFAPPTRARARRCSTASAAEIARRIAELVRERHAAMSGILVVAEHAPRRAARRHARARRRGARAKERAGGPLAVAVIGADPGALRATLGAAGVDEVLTVPAPTAEFEATCTSARSRR